MIPLSAERRDDATRLLVDFQSGLSADKLERRVVGTGRGVSEGLSRNFSYNGMSPITHALLHPPLIHLPPSPRPSWSWIHLHA